MTIYIPDQCDLEFPVPHPLEEVNQPPQGPHIMEMASKYCVACYGYGFYEIFFRLLDSFFTTPNTLSLLNLWSNKTWHFPFHEFRDLCIMPLRSHSQALSTLVAPTRYQPPMSQPLHNEGWLQSGANLSIPHSSSTSRSNSLMSCHTFFCPLFCSTLRFFNF